MLLSSLLLPVLVCGTAFFINFIAIGYHASRAIPFSSMVCLITVYISKATFAIWDPLSSANKFFANEALWLVQRDLFVNRQLSSAIVNRKTMHKTFQFVKRFFDSHFRKKTFPCDMSFKFYAWIPCTNRRKWKLKPSIDSYAGHVCCCACRCLQVAVACIILFVILPLNLVGTVLGRNLSGQPSYPCRINAVPRPIPEKKW